jgi:uncharacterized protein (TIGR03067 family)
LLAELADGDAAAAATFIEHLPAANNMTAAKVRAAGFRLADAQSAIARKSGFAAWPGLARHVAQLRAFEGEWQFDALEVDGTAMPAAAFEQSRMLIDGDRFRMASPEASYEGIFTIDVEATPAHIDIEFVAGPEAGNWSYGIFELDGDALTICLGLVGAARPERFATTRGSGHALERLHRASTARPANVTGGQREPARAAPAPAAVDAAAFELAMTPLLERLQGEWIPLALVSDGKPLAKPMLAYGSRTMIGNETKVVFGGQVMVHAKVRIDESQQPIAIDYLDIRRKTVTLGIMRIDDDVVQFCMAAAGDPRPTELSCEPGSRRTFSTWQRR